MPDLNLWNRQISPEGLIRQPTGGTSIGEAVGAGLQNLGQSGMELSNDLLRQDQVKQQRQRQANALQGAQSVAKVRAGLVKSYAGLETDAPAGAAGFTDAADKLVEDSFADAIKSAPDEETRSEIQTEAESTKSTYAAYAIRFQNASQLAQKAGALQTTLDTNSNVLMNDPRQYDSVVQSTLGAIDAQNLPADRAQEFKTNAVQALSSATMGGMVASDPRGALRQMQSGSWNDKLDPARMALYVGQAQDRIKAQEAQARMEQRQKNAIHQSSVAALADDYITSVRANGGVDPILNGQPMLTTGQVMQAFKDEPQRASEIVQKMQTAKSIGAYTAQVQHTTMAEDDTLLKSLSPAPGQLFTGDQAEVLKSVSTVIDAKREALSNEIKSDLADSEDAAKTELAGRLDDAGQTAFSTGKIPDDIGGLISESGWSDAQKVQARQTLEQQVALGKFSRQVSAGSLPDDERFRAEILSQVSAGGEGSALAAKKQEILKQVIDAKREALSKAPADFVIGQQPSVVVGNGPQPTPLRTLWDKFSDLQGKNDPAAAAAGRAAVNATIAAQLQLGVPEYQAQAIPSGLAKDYAYRLNNAPGDQRAQVAKEVMNLGPKALAQILSAGAPASTAAYASVGASDPVWTSTLAQADQMKPADAQTILKAKAIKQDDLDTAVNRALGDLAATLPPSSFVTYQDAVSRVAVQNIGRGMSLGDAVKAAAAPIVSGSNYSGSLRIPTDFAQADVDKGLGWTMSAIAGGAVPVKTISSGIPGATSDSDQAALREAARQGGLIWLTNEDSTGAVLALPNGRYIERPDGSRFEVKFSDAQNTGRNLPRRPAPLSPSPNPSVPGSQSMLNVQSAAPSPLSDEMLSAREAQPQKAERGTDVSAAVAKFPALAKIADNVVVQDAADPGDGRQLESYPPWESENPNPGKFTSQVFNQKAKGDERTNLIAGDMLHYLGAVDPSSGKAVDPKYRALKEKLLSSMTPAQDADNRHAFAQAQAQGWNGSFDNFMDASRGDEFIMGYITPDKADEWRKAGVYSPEQKKILDRMKAYLQERS